MTNNDNREFKDVVFEDVVFDNNSSVTPYQAKYKYRIRYVILLSNATSSNTTSLNSEDNNKTIVMRDYDSDSRAAGGFRAEKEHTTK